MACHDLNEVGWVERIARFTPTVLARRMPGWSFCGNPKCSCARNSRRVCRWGYCSHDDALHHFGRCGNCGHRRWRHWFVRVDLSDLYRGES